MPDIAQLANILPPGVLPKALGAAVEATAPGIKRVEDSTPRTSFFTLVYWAIRIGGMFGGGYLVKWGLDEKLWTGDQALLIAGAVTSGFIAAWSFVASQIIKPWREHQIAVATAAATARATVEAGRPVEILVQPPPSKVA